MGKRALLPKGYSTAEGESVFIVLRHKNVFIWRNEIIAPL